MKKLIPIVLLTFVLSSCGYLPTEGDIKATTGFRLYNEDKPQEALSYFEEAVELDMNQYEKKEIYVCIANLYRDFDEFYKAFENYDNAKNIDEKYYLVYSNIGIAYRKTEQYEKAEEAYLKAIDLEPEYAESYSSMGSLYIIMSEPKKAIGYFKKAVELDDELAVAYGNGALAYAMAGDLENAYYFLSKSKELGYVNYDIIKSRIKDLE